MPHELELPRCSPEEVAAYLAQLKAIIARVGRVVPGEDPHGRVAVRDGVADPTVTARYLAACAARKLL